MTCFDQYGWNSFILLSDLWPSLFSLLNRMACWKISSSELFGLRFVCYWSVILLKRVHCTEWKLRTVALSFCYFQFMGPTMAFQREKYLRLNPYLGNQKSALSPPNGLVGYRRVYVILIACTESCTAADARDSTRVARISPQRTHFIPRADAAKLWVRQRRSAGGSLPTQYDPLGWSCRALPGRCMISVDQWRCSRSAA